MNGKSIVFTIILIILIGVAIFAVSKFEKKQAPTDNVVPYNEQQKLYTNVATVEEPKCIASFTTNITYPDEKRNHNIEVACNALNEYVLKSGDTFSFNEVLGPFNTYQGYVESTGFDNEGKIIKIVGGGICQVSSTLYNTALMANLEIVERHAHSAPVDYVPAGKDATVCYDAVDLKFKNTTDNDITIKCFYTDETVKIELYTKNK